MSSKSVTPKIAEQVMDAVKAAGVQTVAAPVEAQTTKSVAKPEIETTVTLPDGTVKYKCRFCGKWITKEENVENESGDYCRHLRESFTDADLVELRQGMTVDEPPAGWIKTSSFHKICAKEQIPVSAVVRAFGGDRGINPPLHPKWKFVYCGRARWVDPWTASPEGLAFLRNIARTPTGGEADTAGAIKGKTKSKKSVKPADAVEEAIAEAIAA